MVEGEMTSDLTPEDMDPTQQQSLHGAAIAAKSQIEQPIEGMRGRRDDTRIWHGATKH